MRKWRRIYARDTSFRPPPAGLLRHTLETLNPHALWLEALSRDAALPSSGLDLPVATAAVRPDPQNPGSGYLSLLHFVNDRLTLTTLMEMLAEELYPHGIRKLLGPTHVFPFIGGGSLSSHWHLPVPCDTPYQPPYASEHLRALLRPVETLRLFHFETTLGPTSVPGVMLRRLEPHRLATDLLPLLQNVVLPYAVTEMEAKAMLRWLEPYQPAGFWAAYPSDPEIAVGFVLLYGERSSLIRPNARRTGRLWGGVREEAKRQGIGIALLEAGLSGARERGWGSLSIGPISEGGSAAAFLKSEGGIPVQHYTLYRRGN